MYQRIPKHKPATSNPVLSSDQAEALRLLSQGSTENDVMLQLKVSRETLASWLMLPSFRDAMWLNIYRFETRRYQND